MSAQVQGSWFEELFHAIDTRNWGDLPRFFHAEVVYERPGYPPIEGIDALLEFYSSVRIIAEGKHLLDGGLRDQHKAICWGHFRGRSRSGDELAERFDVAYELDGGVIRKRTTYFFRAAI